MARQHTISDGEFELLEALWRRGPATARDLSEDVADTRGWARTTVKTLLDRMVAKGLVASRRVGNVFEYRAAVEPDDARRSAWRRFVDAAFRGSLGPALAFIARDADLSPKERRELRRVLETRVRRGRKGKEDAHD